MRPGLARSIAVAAAGLWLAGCSANGILTNNSLDPAAAPMASADPAVDASATVEAPPLGAPAAAEPQLYGSDPNDALSLGKKQFRAGNYGLAEKHFRKAVEGHPRDGEAWLGLAASYDRLRRFELADRAYSQAIRILGPTPAILNNQGYSYMLRGDYARAHATLLTAQRKDPDNQFVANNLRLLDASVRTGKAIQ